MKCKNITQQTKKNQYAPDAITSTHPMRYAVNAALNIGGLGIHAQKSSKKMTYKPQVDCEYLSKMV